MTVKRVAWFVLVVVLLHAAFDIERAGLPLFAWQRVLHTVLVIVALNIYARRCYPRIV